MLGLEAKLLLSRNYCLTLKYQLLNSVFKSLKKFKIFIYGTCFKKQIRHFSNECNNRT